MPFFATIVTMEYHFIAAYEAKKQAEEVQDKGTQTTIRPAVASFIAKDMITSTERTFHTLLSQFLNNLLNLLIQLIAFCNEGFQLGIDSLDVDDLTGVLLLHIAGDAEVAVVL